MNIKGKLYHQDDIAVSQRSKIPPGLDDIFVNLHNIFQYTASQAKYFAKQDEIIMAGYSRSVVLRAKGVI